MLDEKENEKKGGKLFYLLFKTRTLLNQIKPKEKH